MSNLADPPWVPQSIEAEQGLLGLAILSAETITAVDGLVTAEDFYEPLHGYLWEILDTSWRAGRVLDPRLLASLLGPNAKVPVGKMSTMQYIARLAAEATTPTLARDYANTIRDLSDQRKLSAIGSQMTVSGKADVVQLAADAIEQIDKIASARAVASTPAVRMEEAVVRAVDEAALAYQRDGQIVGKTWGLRDLDNRTLGMHPGDLIILGGRPGMGKTALGLTVARRTAKAGTRTMIFSLEMTDVPLTQRMISDEIFDEEPLSYWLMRSGRFKDDQFGRIRDAAAVLKNLPIKIEQRPALTVSQIAVSARQEKRRNGLDLLVIDHLHLIKASDRYRGNRVNEIGEITGLLKVTAKELGIPVLVLCQLSRGVEGRDDKRPNLGDLRASGDIEQDADVVVMLYRAAYYLDRSEPMPGTQAHLEWVEKRSALAYALEAIIEKQRSGPIGKIDLFCDIACNAVRDKGWERKAQQAPQQELKI